MLCKRVAFALLAAAAAVAASDESDVTQLKRDTFEDFMKTNDLVLAECTSQNSKFSMRCPGKPGGLLQSTDDIPHSLRPLVRSLQGPCARV